MGKRRIFTTLPVRAMADASLSALDLRVMAAVSLHDGMMGGIKVDIIRAGERKARGGPYEVADAGTIARTQDGLNKTWHLFAELVSKFRPISAKAVLALEGETFTAREAFGLGLIDAIDSPTAIFNAAARLAR